MRIDDEDSSFNPQDPGRIQRVEASLQTQKHLMIAIAAILLILLSSLITGAALLKERLSGPAVMKTADNGTSVETEALRMRLAKLEQRFHESKNERAELVAALEQLQVIEQTAQVDQMNRVLQAQERAWRKFIQNLKDGMFDLSRMVAGSRTWLDEYKQRLDRAIEESKARETQLQGLITTQAMPATAINGKQQGSKSEN